MRIAIIMAAMVALTIVGAAGEACGQGHQPSAADKARAKDLFTQAEGSKQRGDTLLASGDAGRAKVAYLQAAADYKASYELARLPDLLYNMAQALRLGGDKKQALEAYNAYIKLAPTGQGADNARALARELEQEIAAEAATSAAPARTRTASPDGPNPYAPGETSTAGSTGSGSATTSGTALLRDDPPRPGRALRIAGIVSAAAGLVGVSTGVKLGLDARSVSDSLSDNTESWTESHQDLVSQGERAERNMMIAFTVGGLAIVTGGVLYYLGHRVGAEAGTTIALTPAVSAGGASLVLSASW